MEKQNYKVKENSEDYPDQAESSVDDEERLNQIKITPVVENPQNQVNRNVIGDSVTLLAVKNPTSFMIATFGKGLQVFENNKLIFSAKFFFYRTKLKDLVYIDHLNCYFLHRGGKFYRKDVDNHPPYFYIHLVSEGKFGSCLKYSAINRRLITAKDKNSIAVLNLERKELEIEVKTNFGGKLMDFALLRKKETGVISLSEDGYLNLSFINYSMKKICATNHTKIELKEERGERGFSIAASPNNDYALVEIGSDYYGYNSRIMVFKIIHNHLIEAASIDVYNQLLKQMSAMRCWGCIGVHIIWVGVSLAEIFLYDFNTETYAVRELRDQRVNHNQFNPRKIDRLSNHFFLIGQEAKVKTFRIKF